MEVANLIEVNEADAITKLIEIGLLTAADADDSDAIRAALGRQIALLCRFPAQEKAMIKTASWFAPLPLGHVRIGVSRGTRGVPAGYRRCKHLQPGDWWRKGMSLEDFLPCYQAQLDKLDPRKVAADVLALAGGAVAVLTCWERLGRGLCCHRAFVASWLAEAMGEPVPEMGFEHLPQDQHPMLPLPALPSGRRDRRRP